MQPGNTLLEQSKHRAHRAAHDDIAGLPLVQHSRLVKALCANTAMHSNCNERRLLHDSCPLSVNNMQQGWGMLTTISDKNRSRMK